MSMRVILGCLKKADLDYNLINDGDRIAVGVSGGKDSLVLLYALSLYQHFSHKNYSIIAINIGLGFENMDLSSIRKWCKQQQLEFHQIQSKPLIYDVLKLHKTADKLPCSICSKMRKAAMNKAAKKYHCNKVAFAHHGDDAIETLLLNMTHGGRLATFAPKMHLSRENITFIRPLIYCYEKEINHTAKEANLPLVSNTCPNDQHTQRHEMKEILHQYYHRYPASHSNFLTMLSNIEQLDLWVKDNESEESANLLIKKHKKTL